MNRQPVSPVDQAVITRSLVAAADEMGVKLVRSAHSPVVREAQDCSAAILDPLGRVVAQAELIPIQLGSITRTFRACLEFHPLEGLADGDFLVNNDPYSGGQHLPDIFLFSPIFLDGTLIGVTATVVHHIDLGGGAPGLNPGRRRRARGGDPVSSVALVVRARLERRTVRTAGSRQCPHARCHHRRPERAVRSQRGGRRATAGPRAQVRPRDRLRRHERGARLLRAPGSRRDRRGAGRTLSRRGVAR